MFYINFEDHITLKYGIIIKNWPIKRFLAPGKLSRVELEVLLNAFQNGSAGFIQLNDEDWTAWRDSYREGRATAFIRGGASFAPTPDDDDDDNEAQTVPPTSSTSLPPPPSSPSPSMATTSSASAPVPSSTSSTPPPPDSTSPAAPSPADATQAPPDTAQAPPDAAQINTAAPLAIRFVHAAVTNTDGEAVVVSKRKRKAPIKKKTASADGGERPAKRGRKSKASENTAPSS